MRSTVPTCMYNVSKYRLNIERLRLNKCIDRWHLFYINTLIWLLFNVKLKQDYPSCKTSIQTKGGCNYPMQTCKRYNILDVKPYKTDFLDQQSWAYMYMLQSTLPKSNPMGLKKKLWLRPTFLKVKKQHKIKKLFCKGLQLRRLFDLYKCKFDLGRVKAHSFG